MDCLFCKIIAGEIPSKKVYEDETCFAFCDIAPQAKTHILLVPKKHIASLAQAQQEDAALLGHLMLVCAQIAAEQGLEEGFRVVTNVGENGCQSVRHLHLHILGGEKLSEKMS
jgi:histidine triad (HIT) family protein